MATVKDVIEQAAAILGSHKAVADRLQVRPARLSEYKRGTRAMTAVHVAALARICQLDGEQARQLLAIVAIDDPLHAEHRDELTRMFFRLVGAAYRRGLPGNDRRSGADRRAHH